MLNDRGGVGSGGPAATGPAERVKCWSSKLPTVGDGESDFGFAALGAVALHLLHHIHAVHHTAEHHVLPVQPAAHKQTRTAVNVIKPQTSSPRAYAAIQ